MPESKTALVTGALGVLGKAIVAALLEDGFRTVLVDLDPEKLDDYSRSLPEGKSFPVACDISEPAAVDDAVKRIREQWGSVDVLVNNAGILSNNKAVQTTPGEWKRVLAVNLDGAFYLSRAFMEDMKRRRWGRIVNITSLAAKTGGLHYHSSAHEVLGVFSGSARVQFGGETGIVLEVRAGDVVVIPAGVSHRNLGASRNFGVVGAYPNGQSWDMQYGKPGERPAADQRIARVPIPATDPVCGVDGPVCALWKTR